MTQAGRPEAEGEDALLLRAAGRAYPGAWPARIAVAVSGGSDSMAVLHLFVRLAGSRGGAVHAVTVDHRLRPEAADEARFVACACARIGVPHETLAWEHGEIGGNLQDRARRARYALIADWARRGGIGDVVLGHTADDQAETVLMGLAREAGIDGLSGMRRSWQEGGVRWTRPCLQTPRRDLRAYLGRHGVAWVEDPSNADERFLRVRARRALAALAPVGITAEGLARVATNLALARGDLVDLALRSAARIARTDAGAVVLDLAGWKREGNDTRRRLLVAALRWVGSPPHAPRAEKIARFEAAIWEGRSATLAGCRLRIGGAAFSIVREPGAVTRLATPTDALWDSRWRLTGPHGPGLAVRALGAEGLRLCDGWRATGRSRAVLVVSPAVWRGDALVAAPLAGMANGWAAEIATDFPSAVLTH
ncbi:tRNA lysidine(34) synthetase TilS [Albidovulum sp.]|uniref:tRNA lysidine(34) synthetase TilS n=1 Tax=Albidovulum sp. TaxID=1872424 RepID=UPI0039B8E35C